MTEQTRVIAVDPEHPADADLLPAADLLRAGRVVAFPTETVYGLGADALNPEAIQAVFSAKGRPADNPLIVHVTDLAGLLKVVAGLPEGVMPLIERFMPGPLTLVLPRAAQVPDIVTAGLDTVAVRMPEHPVARRLIELAGCPVAAPSANRSGRPSPTTAAHVLEDMAGRIPLIVDGGPCSFGVESTVLDVTGPVPVILRPGAVTLEELRAAIGTVATCEAAKGPSAAPRSPGMKYRHYAPRTPVCIAEGDSPEARSRNLIRQVEAAIADGGRPAVFCSDETAALLAASLPAGWTIRPLEVSGSAPDGAPNRVICLIAHGPRGQTRAAASRLFAALRLLDSCAADRIIAESADPSGIGAAYLNRLRKAAGGGPEPLKET